MTQKTLSYDQLLITPADVFEQMGYHGLLPDQVTQQEKSRVTWYVFLSLTPLAQS